MKPAATPLELIGNTPLIRIQHPALASKPRLRIFAKLERSNPGGSVKDRAAACMIGDAMNAGALNSDKIIIDSTSGNTGIAYAMIGAVKGFRVTIVLPQNASSERQKIIAAFGARLIFSSPFEGADGAIRLAKQIVLADPDRYYQPDQYNNPSNWKAHYRSTGPEIIAQTEGTVTHFIACVGTGGTIMGVGRFLKQHNPAIRVIAVHPDNELHGIEGMKYLGTCAIIPGIFDVNFPDERVYISTEVAYDMTRRLAQEFGLFVGHSSGAAFAAALDRAATIDEGTLVVLFPDCRDRYLSREE